MLLLSYWTVQLYFFQICEPNLQQPELEQLINTSTREERFIAHQKKMQILIDFFKIGQFCGDLTKKDLRNAKNQVKNYTWNAKSN